MDPVTTAYEIDVLLRQGLRIQLLVSGSTDWQDWNLSWSFRNNCYCSSRLTNWSRKHRHLSIIQIYVILYYIIYII